DGFRVAEERDEDGEPDGRLGRGDGDHEEHDDLAFLGPERRAVADEGEIRGVHHDLDREEDRDRGPAQERPRQADDEERGRDEEDVGEWDAADHARSPRGASQTAPTSAASSSTETASKASNESEKRRRASDAPSAAAARSNGCRTGTSVPAVRSSPVKTTPNTTIAVPPTHCWIRRGSLSRGSGGTFRSIRTKRKSTRIAPA